MPLRHDYSDFASGRVFVSAPGRPAFPVRLAEEIFQRCLALRGIGRTLERITLYDPCCGSGYLLATISYIEGETLTHVIGSDTSPDSLELARKNLALLTVAGLDARAAKLTELHASFGKESHAEALASAVRLRERLLALTAARPISTHLFCADATNPAELQSNLEPGSVDLVMTDLPYGQQTAWVQAEVAIAGIADPPSRLLEALRPILAPDAVVAIASDKSQRARHDRYRRVDRFQVGKRRVEFFQLG